MIYLVLDVEQIEFVHEFDVIPKVILATCPHTCLAVSSLMNSSVSIFRFSNSSYVIGNVLGRRNIKCHFCFLILDLDSAVIVYFFVVL